MMTGLTKAKQRVFELWSSIDKGAARSRLVDDLPDAGQVWRVGHSIESVIGADLEQEG